APAPLDRAVERLEIERRIEGVRTQALRLYEPLSVVGEADPAEHAAVDVGEPAAAREVEAHAIIGRVVGLVAEPGEAAGHAEMQGQPAVALQPNQEVLAVAAGILEAVAAQGGDEGLCRQFAEDPGVVDLDALDRLTERVLVQAALVQLDVGQFGHGGSLRVQGSSISRPAEAIRAATPHARAGARTAAPRRPPSAPAVPRPQ